jgi:hypothetical protein
MLAIERLIIESCFLDKLAFGTLLSERGGSSAPEVSAKIRSILVV